MSVAIAIAMNAFGLVLTDSRRVESDGLSYQDNLDKTFQIDNPSIIGAFVGLVEFGGLTVGQHLERIVQEQGVLEHLHELAEAIGDRLAVRLTAISTAEVGFEYRKVEVLLVGWSQITKGKPRICSIELKPDMQSQTIKPTTKLWNIENYYVTIGDDQARIHIRAELPSPNKKFLLSSEEEAKKLAICAVNRGIEQCGMHPYYPEIQSCGGETRIRILCQ